MGYLWPSRYCWITAPVILTVSDTFWDYRENIWVATESPSLSLKLVLFAFRIHKDQNVLMVTIEGAGLHLVLGVPVY